MDLKAFTAENFLIFDGAFGTMLQKRGLLAPGQVPAALNITHPEDITAIHNAYAAAGSAVATTNTFESAPHQLKDAPYSTEQVVRAAVAAARASDAPYTALDIGPTGMLLEPMGTLSFEDAYDSFAQIVKAGADADMIILETFSDLLEIKAALLAAKEHSDLPVIASMTFAADGRTFTGTDPVTAALTLQALGADAVGVNCSLGPKELLPVVEQMAAVLSVPLIVQANAGLPEVVDGKTVYTIAPEAYAESVGKMADLGAVIVGGCCGTDPDYIRAVVDVLKDKRPTCPAAPKRPALTSATGTLFLDDGVTVIGERINPTGKPRLKEAIKSGSYAYINSEAVSQTRQGADVLDVNIGLPEIDEPAVMKKAVREISAVTPLPLQIDSTDPAALEAGLRVYPGIASVNSVNGAPESLEAVLPIVKKYGAVLVGLALDENGIPKTADGRLGVARRIVEAAEAAGIGRERVLIDPLVLTASAQQDQVVVTLESIRRIKEELGVHTTLGASNVSFGLPDRETFNAGFLAAAFGAGLDAPIMNPGAQKSMAMVDVFRVCNAQDDASRAYVAKYSGAREQTAQPDTGTRTLRACIEDGLPEAAAACTEALLKTQDPQQIISEHFIPALDTVGAAFENGTIFLPQLMQSAAAVQAAFELVRGAEGTAPATRGAVLLATVKGDIHDIGKNIVRMLLENYGYEVIDLGADVPVETILETLEGRDIKLIGLSALMTTTVGSMKETIEAVRARYPDIKIMVGGAVLTQEYADMIGADAYAPDAQGAVRIAAALIQDT